MDWAQVLTVFIVIVTNLGTIITLYCHLDSNTNATLEAMRKDAEIMRKDTNANFEAMHKETYALLETIRNETYANVDAIRKETNATVEAIRADLRDFHGRLCSIEER